MTPGRKVVGKNPTAGVACVGVQVHILYMIKRRLIIIRFSGGILKTHIVANTVGVRQQVKICKLEKYVSSPL